MNWRDLIPHSADSRSGEGLWRPQYWAFAAVPALGLYAFEAAKVSSFDVVRAPNVGLATQLVVMFFFFAAWIAAPRAIWAVRHRFAEGGPKGIWRSVSAVAIAGLALSVVHLFALALILRIFHSPPGWNAGHLLKSFAEVWLGYAGFWFILYALAAFVVFRAADRAAPALARIEARRNGKAHSLGLDEIYWIEASGNYVELHTARGGFTLRKSLSAMSKELGGGFIKAHRGALVNAAHVRAIEPQEESDGYKVLLSSGDRAPLSRRRLSAFRDIIRRMPVSG